MGKRSRDRDHPDPEYRRWRRKYPRFPGVAECARLISQGYARRSWADIMVYELADNTVACLPELMEVFRTSKNHDVQLYVVMALDIARPPAAVPFLAEILAGGDPAFVPYAESALKGINTREARTALWNATHA